MNIEYKAYLRVKRFGTNEVVHSVGLTSVRDGYVERVMYGLLGRINTEEYYVDNSEVDEARKAQGNVA